jgi:hypothetical protein
MVPLSCRSNLAGTNKNYCLTTFADDARGFEDEDPQPRHRALSSRAGVNLSYRYETHFVKGIVRLD